MGTTNQIRTKKPSKLSAFFICLVIATALWLLHSLNTVYNHQLSIPVKFINYPGNKMVMGQIPSEVKVNIKGSGLKLLLIKLKEPFNEIEFDFNNLKSDNAKTKFFLSSQQSLIKEKIKFNAEIKAIIPDTISFINKTGFQKEVYVKVPLNLKLAQGFTCVQAKITPATLMLMGKEEDVSRIDTVYTSPLSLVELKSDFEKQLLINSPLTDVYLSENQVQIKLKVDKLIEKETEITLNVLGGDVKYKYALFPSKVKVKYTYATNLQQDLDTSNFKAVADLKYKRNNSVPVSFSMLPSGINIIDFQPKEVEFLMIKK